MWRPGPVLAVCLSVLSAAPAANVPERPPKATANIERIAASNIAIELMDFITIPPSSTEAPLARINYLYHAGDGSGRLFVNDMRGKIYIIRKGVLLSVPFLDVAQVRALYYLADDEEHGLVTFAFHPDFGKKGTTGYGKFYTIHSERGTPKAGANVPVFGTSERATDHYEIVTEWSVDPKNSDRIDPTSARELLRLEAPRHDHAGGQLGFDTSAVRGSADYGLLYISLGDGGNTVSQRGEADAYRLAQNMMSPFGKILRIDPRPGSRSRYAIPRSNPFINRTGYLPEIWAAGLRNPERFSWDTAGERKMLIADIGQASIEEIDLGRAGANFGWSIFEGNFLVDHKNELNLALSTKGTTTRAYVFPVAVYGHEDGFAITGGFVYRGKYLTQLIGKYIFGDIVTGDIFFADAGSLESGTPTKIFRVKLFYHGHETTMRDGVLGRSGRADLRLGLGEDDEIYVLTKEDGAIRRLGMHQKER